MSKFQIAETKTFEKTKSKIDSALYTKIKNFVYPELRKNPFFGTNIKKLKGEFDGVYRYRIGDYRLFYKPDGDKLIVFVLDFKPRGDAYK